jgi:hypothetical protein
MNAKKVCSPMLTKEEEHIYGEPIDLPPDDELLHILLTGYNESTQLGLMKVGSNPMTMYLEACIKLCNSGMHFNRLLAILRDTRAELKELKKKL